MRQKINKYALRMIQNESKETGNISKNITVIYVYI